MAAVLDRIPIDGALALIRAEIAVRRLVALLRGVADPTKTAIGDWSIGEVAAHLVQIFEAYPEMLRGVPSPVPTMDSFSETYDAYLGAHPERDPRVLASRIESASAKYVEQARAMSHEDDVPWHGGVRLPVATLSCLALSEALIHGRDIATAEGRSWSIGRGDAILILRALGHIMEHFLSEKGKRARVSYRIDLRGGGSLTFRFAEGALEVDAFDAGPVDCVISADPVAFLLVGYGRIGLVRPVASGKLVAYGRRPWRAFAFTKLLRNP